MKTLDPKNDEEGSSNSTMVVSFPREIVEDIVSRVPVKSILRCRSVSKPWLNLISNPSFNKLHFTRATTTHRRNGFFISAYDSSTKKYYYLTAGKKGGALTKLMTLDKWTGLDLVGPSCLDGFVYLTTHIMSCTPSRAFVFNPSTRKIFQLPHMKYGSAEHDRYGYLYGFEESTKEHKVLLINKLGIGEEVETKTREFMIYSMSSYSWKKIDVETPVGCPWRRFYGMMGEGVCLNSVVHVILRDESFDILAFDFVAEKFSIISMPQGFISESDGSIIYIVPSLTKINGCLGVVLYDRERSEVRIWLLKDYDNRVWVKEIIQFPESWTELVGKFPPRIDVNMDNEIVFCLSKVTENVISIPVYNMKTKRFRTVQFILDDQFASPDSVKFCHIRCYLESIMPLIDNWNIKN